MDDDTRDTPEAVPEPSVLILKPIYGVKGYEELSPSDQYLYELKLDWINLPTGQPGIVHMMWTKEGVMTEDRSSALVVGAITASNELWQFIVSDLTFSKPRMN